MTRSSWLYLLMFAMLWQTLGVLTHTGQDKVTKNMTDLLTHAQQVEHHHHMDESLHLEAAGDQSTHHHANDTLPLMGLPAVAMATDTEALRALPGMGNDSELVGITLDVPLRPPSVCV